MTRPLSPSPAPSPAAPTVVSRPGARRARRGRPLDTAALEAELVALLGSEGTLSETADGWTWTWTPAN